MKILALAYNAQTQRVGASVFDSAERMLRVCADVPSEDFDSSEKIFLASSPSLVLVSNKCGHAFIDHVSRLCSNSSQCPIIVRPASDFVFSTARNRLLSLNLAALNTPVHSHLSSSSSVPHNNNLASHSSFSPSPSGTHATSFSFHFDGAHSSDKHAMSLYLESIASVSNQLMVGSVGALLVFLAKNQNLASLALPTTRSENNIPDGDTNNNTSDLDLGDGGGGFHIDYIEPFHIEAFMTLNQDCLNSLNIFCDEKHPNMFSSDKKDGLSLFGLLNLTKSQLGKSLLQTWFLRPSVEISVITSRQNVIKQFIASKNDDCAESLRVAVGHIGNIPRFCQNLKKKISLQEWETCLKFAFYCLKIRATIELINHNSDIFEKIRSTFNATILKEIGAAVNNVVDFELSSPDGIVVKQGVDQELDELKRTFDGLDDLLSRVAHDLSSSIPSEYADSLNVMYFPQLGYLITIPLQDHMTTQESFLIPGLDFQFCTSVTVFYKSLQMYQMDESLGDLHSIIADKEIEILQKLQQEISVHSNLLLMLSSTCAELDCLLALAEAAVKYHFVCPQMVETNELDIVEGRHPLYEQCLERFIGNNTRFEAFKNNGGEGEMEEDGNEEVSEQILRVMVLTGPNFSGKSVYLKQIGLIVFMAHIGSFVPAKNATIGITDRIITRIQAIESDAKIQSAFMLDSQQIAYALKNATHKSLVLIDEYGKGTLHCNGVGLFCAALINFLLRGRKCPKVLATTHFHGLYLYTFLQKLFQSFNFELKYFQMDIFHGERADGDNFSFLYRVVKGSSKSSLGMHCAKLAGLPDSVIERAKCIHEELSRINQGVTTDTRQFVASKRPEQVQAVIDMFKSFDCEKGDLGNLWERVRESEKASREG